MHMENSLLNMRSKQFTLEFKCNCHLYTMNIVMVAVVMRLLPCCVPLFWKRSGDNGKMICCYAWVQWARDSTRPF